MNSKTVPCDLPRSPSHAARGHERRKIAIRMGTLGAENGLTPIRTIGVGDKIDQHFVSHRRGTRLSASQRRSRKAPCP